MLSKISSMLDTVANSLEKKGFIKEAYELDKVADAVEKLSWDIDEKPLIVKVKPNSTIQADTLILIGQLKRDIAKALNYIAGGATRAYTNYYDQATAKTQELSSRLRSELEKANVNIWSKNDLFKGMDVDSWKSGNSYDISKIYDIGKEIVSSMKGYAEHKEPVKGLKLLNLIAETYDKSNLPL